MSGVECVGLVLAVIPLLISAAEHYRDGVDTINQTVRSKHRDESLLEFYDEISYEVWQLRVNIKRLIKALPSLSVEAQDSLTNAASSPDLWAEDELSEALSKKLGAANDRLFTNSLRRILEALEALILDDTNILSRGDVVSQEVFCVKLTQLRQDMLGKKKLTTLYERVRFNTHERKRTKYLERITKHNRRLHHLLEDATHLEPLENSAIPKPPSLLGRTISRDLYEALSCYWKCGCKSPHAEELYDAKLCLKRDFGSKNFSGLSFSMLFTSASTLQECLIHVVPRGSAQSKAQAQKIDSICSLVEEARGCGICLQMLLDEKELWRIKPQTQRLASHSVINLDALLKKSMRLRLRDKRILAAALANTVLQLSEGPWMGQRWDKEYVSFVESTQSAIDFERPYLSTKFDTEKLVDDFMSIHPSPSLLTLGILLLEIELGHPVECTELDLTDGKVKNANSDLTAAMRAFQDSVDDLYDDYKKAIQACLEPKFINYDQNGMLDDEEMYQAVYENIVAPLESELYNGFKIKLTGFG